jgi:hypothetical protein
MRMNLDDAIIEIVNAMKTAPAPSVPDVVNRRPYGADIWIPNIVWRHHLAIAAAVGGPRAQRMKNSRMKYSSRFMTLLGICVAVGC